MCHSNRGSPTDDGMCICQKCPWSPDSKDQLLWTPSNHQLSSAGLHLYGCATRREGVQPTTVCASAKSPWSPDSKDQLLWTPSNHQLSSAGLHLFGCATRREGVQPTTVCASAKSRPDQSPPHLSVSFVFGLHTEHAQRLGLDQYFRFIGEFLAS